MVMLLTSDQLNTLQSLLNTLSKNQLIWVSGYVSGMIDSDFVSKEKIANISNPLISQVAQCTEKVVLISASQTGNSRRVAEQLRDDFLKSKINVVLFNARDFKFKKIAEIKLLICIVSTYGEGEPPEEAVSLYKYLFSNRAVRMKNTKFAVFSLGDRSYKDFAKAGKDLDNQLEKLGANRIYNRVDADVDFQSEADLWRKKIVSVFHEQIIASITLNNRSDNVQKNILSDCTINICKEFPVVAHLLSKQKITSCNAIKDIHHLEIDINGSNLCYQPGDSLGIWYENDPDLVYELLELLDFTGDELVKIKDMSISVFEALKKHFELTQNNPIVIENFAAYSQNRLLLDLIKDQKKMNTFIKENPIIEMVRHISIKLEPQDLLKLLRPMKPRFYSISSAQSEVGNEIHITVSVIRYKINGRSRSGGASSYLVDRLQENDKIRIFVEPNYNFRLPKNPNTSIIMIGSGTGIAPFRAFMQQRASDKAIGKNWLFFGNLRFTEDFLYQIEWQHYFKTGLLNRIDTAWSRDQNHKIYVQDRLLTNSINIWSWIQDGAHIYVCGNAKYMARDVEQTLINLASKHGNMSLEEASDFWDKMRIQCRYQRDVY